MKKVLYAKYNRMRKKQFQTKIEIVDIDNKLQVIKTPLSECSKAHILSIATKYEKYKDYYKNVSLAKTTTEDDSVVIDFVQGQSLNAHLTNLLKDTEGLVNEIKKNLALLSDVNEKYKVPFEVTTQFEEIFGNIEEAERYTGEAYSVCDMDQIFDNFIQTVAGMVSVDYEWLLEVVVPKQFPIYRALRTFYIVNIESLIKSFEEDEFMAQCGIKTKDLPLFRAMEAKFLEYAHGVSNEEVYTERYKKPINGLPSLMHALSTKNRIEDLEKETKNRTEIEKNLREQFEEISNGFETALRVKDELEKIVRTKEEHIESLELENVKRQHVVEVQQRLIKEQQRLIEEQAKWSYPIKRVWRAMKRVLLHK